MGCAVNFDTLKDKFPTITVGEKILVAENIADVLSFLKNNPQYDFDMLSTIVAVDLQDKIELIYYLYSTNLSEFAKVSVYTEKFTASVVNIYKSAYFDECEIYDLFGVEFVGNPNLKRLFMSETWVGHPLKKDYVQEDTRLCWND